MKALWLLVLLCLVSSSAFAQDRKLDVIPGTPLNNGVGLLADPAAFHGLAVGLQAGLGVSVRSKSFGYDGVSASMRWVPGTNALGRRLAFVVGAANWYTPPYSGIYPSSVLTEKEQAAGATINNALLIGFSIRVIGNRDPTSTEAGNSAFWDGPKGDAIKRCYEEWIRMSPQENPGGKEAKHKQCNELLWKDFTRAWARRPSLVVGSLARVGAFANEAAIGAGDFYATFAAGKDTFDFALGAHYLIEAGNPLAKDAATGSIGFFFDVTDDPPPTVIGLTASVGYYRYKNHVLRDAMGTPIMEAAPNQVRFDGILSISGAPITAGLFGGGIGIKYSYLHNGSPSVKDDHQVMLILSTSFRKN